MNKKLHAGFTMVELLIVMTIIGMLVTMGTFSYQGIMMKARNQQRKSDLSKIKKALIEYYADNGEYPATVNASGVTIVANCETNGWCSICDNPLLTDTGPEGYIPNLAPKYIDRLPRDPRESRSGKCLPTVGHCYIYRSDGYDFKVIAHCTPEGTPDPKDPYYDPRIVDGQHVSKPGVLIPRGEYAYQVSSSDRSLNTW